MACVARAANARLPLEARAPFVHVDQANFPEAFARIEQEWSRLRAEQPSDPELAQGHLQACAAFWNPEPLQDWVRQLRERQMPERFKE